MRRLLGLRNHGSSTELATSGDISMLQLAAINPQSRKMWGTTVPVAHASLSRPAFDSSLAPDPPTKIAIQRK